VDKPKKSSGVTIKINGKEKTFSENTEHEHQISHQAAATSENNVESFDWILSDNDGTNEDEWIIPPKKKKKVSIASFGVRPKGHKRGRINATVIKAPLVAIVCAVLIGTGFGFLVLKTVTGTREGEVVPSAEPVAGSVSEGGSATGKQSIALPTLKAFMVQGGVFSAEEAAKTVQEQLKNNSVPAEIIQLDNQFYIFLGMADSLPESKSLAGYYKLMNVDAFWKEIALAVNLKKGTEEDKQMLQQLVAIYRELSNQTAVQMLGSESTIDLKNTDAQLEGISPKETSAYAKQINNLKGSLRAAADMLDKYKNSKQSAMLGLSQEELLGFIKEYQKLTN
jgi:stage II sporulation protein B